MRLSLILTLFLQLSNSVFAFSQNALVTLNFKEVTGNTLFREIQKQTGYYFILNETIEDKLGKINVTVKDKSVEDLLNDLLAPKNLDWHLENDIIIVTESTVNKNQVQQTRPFTIQGTVKDENGDVLPGVTVRIDGTTVGTSTDANGVYKLSISLSEGKLIFSFIGYKQKIISFKEDSTINVILEEDVEEMDEVVITGMFTRRAESFTGSVSTFKNEDLKRVGNQNIIASLKNLDPSFLVIDNLEFGSDPNRLPEINLRGKTSIPDLKGDYVTNPNQPLFILDGFETTLEKVYDLDMNLVSSVTILKDAAAKAIYGSKAANGVVVIETFLPKSGKLQVSYSGSLDVTAPDLTSYNLANAREKLEAERLAGRFQTVLSQNRDEMLRIYNTLQKEIEKGVDTYWLSQPLRTGLGQKHSLNFSGGDNDMRYMANINYNNTKGAMKGSERNVISGGVTLSYRLNNLSFRNQLSIDVNKSKNSPYGSFSEYAIMNPYLRIKDQNGNLIKNYTPYADQTNPIYDAKLGGIDESSYTTFTENFYLEWDVIENLRLTARTGISKSSNDSDKFTPATHSKYSEVHVNNEEDYLERGEYISGYGKSFKLSLDVGISYSFQKDKHLIFTNALWNIESQNSRSVSNKVIGFPSEKMNYITMGIKYPDEGKPGGSESKSNAIGIVGSINYSYDNRYLADFSYRATASSQFGSNNRWGHFWSAGIGWNIHNENFIKNLHFIDNFKVRATVGYTGSQNFDPYQAMLTYEYDLSQAYDGSMGSSLMGLSNDDLKWQQQYDRNFGVDFSVFKLITINFDYYIGTAKDLLTDINLPTSTGFRSYKENMGETENKGFQLGTNFRLYSNVQKQASVNVFFNMAHNTNKIKKISNSLKEMNREQDEIFYEGTQEEQRKPKIRFEEGQSLDAIWAVPSLGIDPITGRELFMKKEGTVTQTWSADDQEVFGNSQPKYTGNLGANIEYNGISLNLSFSFKTGGQTYNSTLVNKIENVDVIKNNIDKRVLYERWNTAGDEAKYKGINDQTVTKPTSRFVEDLDEFIFSSVNVGYDFRHVGFIKNSRIQRLRFSFNMNDIGRLTTVKQERGTSYPFARDFSFSLQANF